MKNVSVKVGGVSLGGGLSKLYMIDDVETDIRLSADDDIAALAEQYKNKRNHW
jgi:L-serine dehydratase